MLIAMAQPPASYLSHTPSATFCLLSPSDDGWCHSLTVGCLPLWRGRGREGGKEGGREEGREGGREGGREIGRRGGREGRSDEHD